MVSPKQSAQELTRQQYQLLHDQLSAARGHCAEGKGAELRHRADAVQAVLTALNQQDLCLRTDDFDAVRAQLLAVDTDMQKLKSEINTVVSDLAVANKVVSAIDSAASAAGKFLA